ncbi:chorismate mutase [Jaminaea rosea]|uniref:Chorismate mutase n=1 Tax=Jaminaea rosea TaxID=1569628 RepID=A0A316UUX6_9BASI|nr:chorismate mutase [Jaminaea rosea]PWN29079.1 chorismate mutase [Jaminaea rosea]
MAPSSNVFNLATSSASQILSLESIRSVLQRLEDTIVFQLIERAQFARNAPMYYPGAFPELIEKEGWHASWVEWFLKETEGAHAKCRRWDAPDEYPFTKPDLLPKAILPPIKYPKLLYDHGINVNTDIYTHYRDVIVPTITSDDDDGQYGSSAVRDVETLAALSRRIHFGMFVSESKFRSDPQAFIEPIRKEDREKLEALITKPAVEQALLVRLREKARVYGQDLDKAVGSLATQGQGATAGTAAARPASSSGEKHKIDADDVVHIYQDFVIPMTKRVEVDYLIKRLDHLSPSQLAKIEAGEGYAEEA